MDEMTIDQVIAVLKSNSTVHYLDGKSWMNSQLIAAIEKQQKRLVKLASVLADKVELL